MSSLVPGRRAKTVHLKKHRQSAPLHLPAQQCTNLDNAKTMEIALKVTSQKFNSEKVASEKLNSEKIGPQKLNSENFCLDIVTAQNYDLDSAQHKFESKFDHLSSLHQISDIDGISEISNDLGLSSCDYLDVSDLDFDRSPGEGQSDSEILFQPMKKGTMTNNILPIANMTTNVPNIDCDVENKMSATSFV